MNAAKYDSLLSRLLGLKTWGLKITVLGMTIEIGPEVASERGEWSIWVKTRTRVAAARKRVVDVDYPTADRTDVLTRFLSEKTVIRAGLDDSNNSLRILLAPETLLSVFPGPAESESPWILFDNRGGPDTSLIVYSDRFEGKLA